jgi:hypothetical protein
VVRTGQPLGSLAAYLLEPQSADGLATWNFFDAELEKGKDFPVLRLPAATTLRTTSVRPLPEEQVRDRPITYEAVYGGRGPNFSGSPIAGLIWLDDGDHYLQRRGGQLNRVHAATGRSTTFFDPEKLTRGLTSRPELGETMPSTLARSPFLNLNPQRTGALFTHGNDLYYCNLDGSGAVRLTKTPGTEELPTFSPDGKFVVFVRGNNLYAVEVATQTERTLTRDGSDRIFNGKADWVYGEEI